MWLSKIWRFWVARCAAKHFNESYQRHIFAGKQHELRALGFSEDSFEYRRLTAAMALCDLWMALWRALAGVDHARGQF